MSINIIDLVKGYVSNELVSKASTFLGENEGGVTKAVSGLIPSILGGILTKGTESETGAQQLLDSATEVNNTGLLGNLSSLLGNTDLLSKGTGIFNSLFGGKSNSIIDTIASFAGIKSSSTGSLVSMLTPLVLGLLGKHASDNKLNAGGFSSFLSSQKNNILGSLPSGLGSIGSLLGLGSIGASARETVQDVKEAAANTYNHVEDTVESASGGSKWLLPLLLLAALAFLLWWMMGKGCNKGDGAASTTDSSATVTTDSHAEETLPSVTVKGVLDSVTGNFIYDVGANKEIKLADGTTLTVGENSTEARLFNMLSDASFAVDTVNKSANWVVLDRVYFETGKSVLTAASDAQVKNIAAILKNFPKAAIKIGGYTDNTGDAAVNKKISGERAKIVGDKLVNDGAAKNQVVETEGYGPEFPVCAANDTPECKAQNRRVDIKVAVK